MQSKMLTKFYLRQSWKPLRAAFDITWALLDGTGIRDTPLPNVTTLPPLKPVPNEGSMYSYRRNFLKFLIQSYLFLIRGKNVFKPPITPKRLISAVFLYVPMSIHSTSP